jgi:hypothetical protein
MSRWVDVRIPAALSATAVGALTRRFDRLTFSLDLRSLALREEAVLGVEGQPLPEVRVALLAAGVEVLGIGSRLAPELTAESTTETAHETAHDSSGAL